MHNRKCKHLFYQTVDKRIRCADGQHFCLWQKLRKRSRIYLCDAPVRKAKSFPSLIRRSTNRVKVAARSVPKGNLRTCHGDRAHISGNAAAHKRALCKQSDNGRGEWRVSSSTPKMRRRRRRLAFRQVLSLCAF